MVNQIASDFITLLKTLLTGLLGIITELMQGVVEIFYIPGDGEGVLGGFTIYGLLLLVSFVMTMIWIGIKFLRSFFKKA